MANEKDIVSKESKPQPKTWAEQSGLERLKSVGKGIANVLRTPTSKLANAVAKSNMYTMEARTNVDPPKLYDKDINNNPIGTEQLQRDTFKFTSKSGKEQSIEGFHLKAQPGKPTMVYFGGSDFDRNSASYREAIRKMANRAKEEGCGFAVYDYPRDASEQRIKDWVKQVQDHLETDLGAPKNLQAYSGYSLGSFSAAHAANINQDAVGLQITSGFSSGRMAQKEGIIGAFGKAGSDALVDKSQLTDVLDTALECRQLNTRLSQPTAKPMPISLVYSSSEDFGKAGNRHMSAVQRELGITVPGTSNGNVSVAIAVGTGHLQMMATDEHLNSFQQMVKDSVNLTQAQNQVVAVTTPTVTVTAPTVATQDTAVRPRSQSVGEKLREQAQSGKRLSQQNDKSVRKELGVDSEQLKEPTPTRARSRTVG